MALVSALVLRILRGASPRLRYAAAAIGLLVMALLPLRHLVPPRREATTFLQIEGRAQSRLTPLPLALSASSPALRTRTVLGLERALPWVVLTWILGACLSLLRLAGGWAWLQRLRWRRAQLAPDALQRALLDLCRRAGLKRAVTLLTCEGLAGPSVVGILRPAILVPAGWFLNLPPDHVEALLAHELAHVLRHDYAVNLLQSLLEVVLFYHPGVWWLSWRIRAERELACDTFAVRLMGDSLPLAEALTDLERRGHGRTSFEPAPAAHGGSLMERIKHLLMPHPRTSSAPVLGAIGVLALFLASVLRLAAQSPDPTPTVPPAMPLPTQGRTIDKEVAFYIQSRCAKDPEGRDIPFTQVLDIKANQVPLNQVWNAFAVAVEYGRSSTLGPKWAHRNPRIPGPRVNIDLDSAKPEEVLALLNRLAKVHGVAPYEAPTGAEPGPFEVVCYLMKDGKQVLNLHARQVSLPYLNQLMATARNLKPGAGTGAGRDADTYPGPKVDAIFEGLTLPELEARVRKLQAEAK